MWPEATSVCGLKVHREADEEPEGEREKKELDVLETTYMLKCVPIQYMRRVPSSRRRKEMKR